VGQAVCVQLVHRLQHLESNPAEPLHTLRPVRVELVCADELSHPDAVVELLHNLHPQVVLKDVHLLQQVEVHKVLLDLQESLLLGKHFELVFHAVFETNALLQTADMSRQRKC